MAPYLQALHAGPRPRIGQVPWNTGYQAQHDIQFVEQARTLISDLEPDHNVFLIGTTNHVDNIDPAILRGGRFSEKIEISVPDKAGYGRLMASLAN